MKNNALKIELLKMKLVRSDRWRNEVCKFDLRKFTQSEPMNLKSMSDNELDQINVWLEHGGEVPKKVKEYLRSIDE